jgi:glycosyltransferase involved in cell wall biosynthesis
VFAPAVSAACGTGFGQAPELMARPRLCFVLPSLAGGGAERAAVQILNRLDGTRWERQLYLFHREGAYLDDVEASVDLFAGTHRSRLPRFEQLCRFLRRTRPQIVVAFLSYFSVLLAARIAHPRTRVVFDQQNPNSGFLADGDFAWQRVWRTWAFSYAARAAYRGVDHVIAISQGVADDLVGGFGLSPGRVDVIHNPVDIDAVARAAREALEPVHQRRWRHPVVVAAGRLAEQKNYPLLIDAIAMLRQRVDAQLFILGSGGLEGELRRSIANRGLEQAVVLCGFQANPWKYMARADVFALTSRYEGFGNVMAEALACGVPVVATTSAGARDIVRHGENGWLVEQHDPAAVADALARVLCDSELRRRLAAGARESAQRFALPAIAAAYDRVFERLVA